MPMRKSHEYWQLQFIKARDSCCNDDPEYLFLPDSPCQGKNLPCSACNSCINALIHTNKLMGCTDWLELYGLTVCDQRLWCRMQWIGHQSSWGDGWGRIRSMCLWWFGCLLLALDSVGGLAWQISYARLTHLGSSQSVTNALRRYRHHLTYWMPQRRLRSTTPATITVLD